MGNLTTGRVLSSHSKGMGSCVVCDDCGRVFTVQQEITNGADKKKRCDRCAARICEEKLANAPNARKCSNCQALFGVTERIAELPQSVAVNCQRCSEVHRTMVKEGAYLEVILQKGDEKLYICCPRTLQSELRRCITSGKQQGYMLNTQEDTALGFQDS